MYNINKNLVYLVEKCKPKQWTTISTDNFTESGFPVYGANGKIGFYSKYNHESPTLLITCRGATCGSLNICEPYSYINGNAMSLDNLSDDVNILYLYYFLSFRGFDDIISGSAQPQITRQGLMKVKIPLPPIEEQHRIVKILDLAQSLIEKRKQAIAYLDDYIKAVFLDMFGDPVSNPKVWKCEFIGAVCKVTKLAGYEYTKYIKYEDKGEIIMIRGLNVKQGKIRLDNIKWIKKGVSDLLERSKLFVGDVVMTYIGVNIGDVAIITENDKYHLAPNVSKITPHDQNYLNSFFLLYFLMFNRIGFSQFTTNTAKQALNMGSIRKLRILIPDLPQQERFVEIVQKAESLKQNMQSQLKELEDNFQAQLQRGFRGE